MLRNQLVTEPKGGPCGPERGEHSRVLLVVGSSRAFAKSLVVDYLASVCTPKSH